MKIVTKPSLSIEWSHFYCMLKGTMLHIHYIGRLMEIIFIKSSVLPLSVLGTKKSWGGNNKILLKIIFNGFPLFKDKDWTEILSMARRSASLDHIHLSSHRCSSHFFRLLRCLTLPLAPFVLSVMFFWSQPHHPLHQVEPYSSVQPQLKQLFF